MKVKRVKSKEQENVTESCEGCIYKTGTAQCSGGNEEPCEENGTHYIFIMEK